MILFFLGTFEGGMINQSFSGSEGVVVGDVGTFCNGRSLVDRDSIVGGLVVGLRRIQSPGGHRRGPGGSFRHGGVV